MFLSNYPVSEFIVTLYILLNQYRCSYFRHLSAYYLEFFIGRFINGFIHDVYCVYSTIEQAAAETHQRLRSEMDHLDVSYELIFVNDGSRDRTADILYDICKSDNNVKLVEFSRNFGHEMAITAGMDYASGKAVVIIDADLQDPPELIPKMLEKWHDGYDVVIVKSTTNLDPQPGSSLDRRAFYCRE